MTMEADFDPGIMGNYRMHDYFSTAHFQRLTNIRED